MSDAAHSDIPLALEDRHSILSDQALDQLFRGARTFYSWEDRDVSNTTLRALYELLQYGPTSANQSPARFLFLKGESQKKLVPHLIEPNVEKTVTAPVTVVLAWDWNFHEKIPQLFPHNPEAKEWFAADDARFENGFRNSSLQGAYLIMAARALGLDCGAMSGFDKDGVDETFFKNDLEMGAWRSNFLINLGYGTTEKLFPRLPKLGFDEGARILD
ncbi:malonic semialdehyde reductase [Maricaulaceae bacterium NA33B04]|nr:malonic semialdehyde reductase [Maricaulaceae bacterium NA33B04]